MERRYKFWLETDLGDRIVWRSLTERQALEMYRRTRAAHPDNVRGCTPPPIGSSAPIEKFHWPRAAARATLTVSHGATSERIER